MKRLLTLLAACGGGDPVTPDATVPTGDTPHTGSGSMTLHVVEAPGSLNTTAERPGITGAVISLVLPGGEHREVMTGADGKVVVDGIDWSAGTVDAIAWAPGHSMYGVNGARPETFANIPHVDSGDVVFSLIPEVALTTLSVTVDGSSDALVSGDHVDASLYGSGAFGLSIEANVAQKLLVGALSTKSLEVPVTRWATFDVPATGAPATLEVDIAAGGTTVPSTVFTHHVTLPTGHESAQLLAQVATIESLGRATESSMHAGMDGSSPRDAVVEYVAFSSAALQLTTVQENGVTLSRHVIVGTPVDGTSYTMLPPLADATVTGETVPMPQVPDGAYVSVVGGDINNHRFRIEAPPGTTAITVPPLPTGAPHLAYTTQVTASLHYDPHARIYADQTFSPPLVLKL